MTQFSLGVNNCFAVKRWPEPERWARIIGRDWGVELCQFTFDLLDPRAGEAALGSYLKAVRQSTECYGVTIHSTFTGLAAYSSNLLAHPDAPMREDALDWLRSAVDVTAKMGVPMTGGFLGALSVEDSADSQRRASRLSEWKAAIQAIARHAKMAGLQSLLVENMAVGREPPTSIDEAREVAAIEADVPIRLCIDVGHMLVREREGRDLDPYEWLRELGPQIGVVHLQQSDTAGDRHWPFTEALNRRGRIRAELVLEALEASGAQGAILILEVIHAFEADENRVLDEMQASVEYWKAALHH